MCIPAHGACASPTAGVTIAIDTCYEVWDSGVISVPWNFNINELRPQLIKLLGAGRYNSAASNASAIESANTSSNNDLVMAGGSARHRPHHQPVVHCAHQQSRTKMMACNMNALRRLAYNANFVSVSCRLKSIDPCWSRQTRFRKHQRSLSSCGTSRSSLTAHCFVRVAVCG